MTKRNWTILSINVVWNIFLLTLLYGIGKLIEYGFTHYFYWTALLLPVILVLTVTLVFVLLHYFKKLVAYTGIVEKIAGKINDKN